jgi:Secretion system C-terminal sorting domain
VQGGSAVTTNGFYTGYWANCTNCGLWIIPELAGGQTTTLDLPVFPLDANGAKTATAKLLSLDQTDGNLANNQSSFTVTPSANIQTPPVASIVRDYAFTASPNPFSESLELKVSAVEDKEANILIYNNLGALMKSEKRSLSKGINKLKMDGTGFSEGFYFIVLKMPNVKDMYVKVLKVR